MKHGILVVSLYIIFLRHLLSPLFHDFLIPLYTIYLCVSLMYQLNTALKLQVHPFCCHFFFFIIHLICPFDKSNCFRVMIFYLKNRCLIESSAVTVKEGHIQNTVRIKTI